MNAFAEIPNNKIVTSLAASDHPQKEKRTGNIKSGWRKGLLDFPYGFSNQGMTVEVMLLNDFIRT